MWNYFLNKDQQRKRALKSASHEVMRDYLSQPFSQQSLCWDQVEIVSLDFETTGLDPASDQILSYGKVHIKSGGVFLDTARHELIKPEQAIPESSAIVHHITDDQASTGRSLKSVLPELLAALKGRTMLVHYNKIEQGFLDAACRALYGSPFIIPTIDTLFLGSRVLSLRNHSIRPDRLRLFHLIDDFNLPHYKAHNALYDAISTAELFLVLESEITPSGSTRLKDLLL